MNNIPTTEQIYAIIMADYQIGGESSTPIPPMGNYGVVDTPEDYDNNDVNFSHQVVIDKLKEILETLK